MRHRYKSLRRNGRGICTGRIIAQRLGRQPVLTVCAVEVTAEHAESQSVGAWQNVKKRFLLGRITGKGCDVVNRNAQMSTFVKPDLADPAFAIVNEAAMTACKTFECTILEMFS